MKVLLLSKEFRDGEGVSEYCKNIAEHLVENGHEAAIVSFDDGSYYSIDDRVEVHRVPLHFEGDNIYNWAMMLNNELKGQARELMEDEDFDVIHANDWATIPGGIALKKHAEKPFAVTIHSTENERGFEGDHAAMISELEWQGAFEAEKVFVTKEDTKNSILFDLDVPGEKVSVIDPYEAEWRSRILDEYQELIKSKQEVVNKE
ncbi:MAG: glycosyltransferase family 4 protein [Candidatus Nanohaloarchaea archaeon]